MIFNNYVALDITCSDVRVLSVKRNRIRKWGSAPIPEGAVKDGMILEPHTVSVVIDNLFKSLKASKNRVLCTVTGLPFIYRVISMPKDESAVPDEAIERAARKEMSLNQEDMYLLWQATEATPNKEETDYFVLGVPRTSLKPLLETLEKAKIKPYSLDVKPLALARAASFKDAMLISLEQNYYDIVLVANGLVRVMHSVNLGNKGEDRIGIVNELIDGLNKAIKSFNRDFPQNEFQTDTPILVSGSISADEEILKLIQEATGHPVNILPALLEAPPEMPLALYAANIGLIAKKLKQFINPQYYDINVNLLVRVKKEGQVRQALGYAGAIIVILILAGVVYKSNDLRLDAAARVDSLQKEVTRLTQQLATAQKNYTQLQATKQAENDKLQVLVEELKTLTDEHKQIEDKQRDYAGRITLINVAFPAGDYYTRIDMQPTSLRVAGQVLEPFEILEFTEALEKTTVFASARVETIEPLADSEGATFTAVVVDK